MHPVRRYDICSLYRYEDVFKSFRTEPITK
jgi:hypothetical protein